MDARRGRNILLSSGALGIAVLGAAGFAFRDSIREEYWLWKLEKADETGRILAMRKLGEMRSLRAVPRMIGSALRYDLVNEVEAVLSSLEPEVIHVLIDLSEDEEATFSTRMFARRMARKLAGSRRTVELEVELKGLLGGSE